MLKLRQKGCDNGESSYLWLESSRPAVQDTVWILSGFDEQHLVSLISVFSKSSLVEAELTEGTYNTWLRELVWD